LTEFHCRFAAVCSVIHTSQSLWWENGKALKENDCVADENLILSFSLLVALTIEFIFTQLALSSDFFLCYRAVSSKGLPILLTFYVGCMNVVHEIAAKRRGRGIQHFQLRNC
jgi:hypothetical protein